jgi:DNA mismatch endonuclease (patch repair protein)
MASIRKRDTVPELTLRRALWGAGIRGWRCHVRITGTPDLVFARWKLAVFVDGVWWHGHPDYLPRGRRGPYWDAKIAKNQTRDTDVNRILEASGWTVLRMWDLDVLADPGSAVEIVCSTLRECGWSARASSTSGRRGVVRAEDQTDSHLPA